ncbi:MAG TPA: amidohydrolase family protein [Capillimicrobium sp.]|jgi:predicted TIM-barrel fold metal-dependent hydrolase
MADIAMVDTHVHFWDLNHPRTHYSWLQPEWVHPLLGNIDAIKFPFYGGEQYGEEVAGSNVSKAVHVQAALGSDDPVDETVWLQEQAEQTGWPHAIVADARLAAGDVAEVLDRHAEASPLLRGVRDFGEGDYLVDPAWQRGYAELGKRGLVCDLDCFWENMHKARDLAQAHPETTLVLDHAGFPLERTDEYFADWKRGISTLAEAESAICKISGLGMRDPEWTVDSIRPWFEHCVEAFGIDRCVLGTNWPVDKLYSDYAKVVDAYAQIASQYSEDEQVALFSGNAERVFRI